MLAKLATGFLCDGYVAGELDGAAPHRFLAMPVEQHDGQGPLAGIGGGGLPSVPSAGGTTPPVGGPGFARGGSFIVPQGFPNDTFPMRVSSGERVTVSPRGSGGGNFVFNVSVSNDAMLNALMRKVRGLAMMNAV